MGKQIIPLGHTILTQERGFATIRQVPCRDGPYILADCQADKELGGRDMEVGRTVLVVRECAQQGIWQGEG